MYKVSKLKTDKDGFNNCLSQKEIRKILKEIGLKIQYYDDFDDTYFQNGLDTMVFMPQRKNKNYLTGLKIAMLVNRLYPDEVHFKNNDGELLVRFWWD